MVPYFINDFTIIPLVGIQNSLGYLYFQVKGPLYNKLNQQPLYKRFNHFMTTAVFDILEPARYIERYQSNG